MPWDHHYPVLVAGATGGVGQLVVAEFLRQGYSQVRALVRDRLQADRLFGGDDRPQELTLWVGDLLQPETLADPLVGVGAVVCCTGTTAFPSARWGLPAGLSWGDWGRVILDRNYRQTVAPNDPIAVDQRGVMGLIAAVQHQALGAAFHRFVFVSSCGVLRRDQFPYSVLNSFGVLDAKWVAEMALMASGLPHTIVRPGRLIDGPYTSYDLNTLLKASTGGKLGVVLSQGDRVNGQTSRLDVAAACVACLDVESTAGQAIDVINQGDRPPGLDWPLLLGQLGTSKN